MRYFILALGLLSMTAFATDMTLDEAQQMLRAGQEIPAESPWNTPEVTAHMKEAFAVVQQHPELVDMAKFRTRTEMCCGRIWLGYNLWRFGCVPGKGTCTDAWIGCGTPSDFCR
jgi:hypothetical protein